MSTTDLRRTLASIAIAPESPPRRLARGIWLPGDLDDVEDPRAALRRVAEALPPHSVFVGWTAARLHALWLPLATAPHRIEIASTAPGRGRDMKRTRRPELAGSRRQLREDEIEWIDGLPVTTPSRTWLDLAGRLRLVELVALGDSVLRTGVDPAELTAPVSRSSRRRGTATARLALPMLDARSRSRPESHLRVELTVPGWPPFEVNEAVADVHGEWLAEPDLSNEQYGVAVEYQGGWHSEDAQMRRDLTRAVTVTGDRWQTLFVGPSETFTHPDRLRAAVAATLRRAGWSGRRASPDPDEWAVRHRVGAHERPFVAEVATRERTGRPVSPRRGGRAGRR